MARKAFTFRLRKLLDIRVMREKQAQSELLARRRKLEVEQQRMAQLEAEEQALLRRMTPQPGQPVNIEERWACERFLVQKRKEQEMHQLKVDSAERAVAEQQQVVRQAGIDVKVLEKLEEKQREEHREEQLREEAIFLDDLAAQQFIRQEQQKRRRRSAQGGMQENSTGEAS